MCWLSSEAKYSSRAPLLCTGVWYLTLELLLTEDSFSKILSWFKSLLVFESPLIGFSKEDLDQNPRDQETTYRGQRSRAVLRDLLFYLNWIYLLSKLDFLEQPLFEWTLIGL